MNKSIHRSDSVRTSFTQSLRNAVKLVGGAVTSSLGRSISLVTQCLRPRASRKQDGIGINKKQWQGVFGNRIIRNEIFRYVQMHSAPSCANHIRMLAEKNKGNPAEFQKILDRFFSEEEIRDVGINFKFLDDDQKFCAMRSIRKIDPSKIDSIEVRGFHWSPPMSESEGRGTLNNSFLEFMSSAPVKNKLTSLSMRVWLTTHRKDPPPHLFMSLHSLKKLDLTFDSQNKTQIYFYPIKQIDEIKIDLGHTNSPCLLEFALKSTKNLIITGNHENYITLDLLNGMKHYVTCGPTGGFPDEITIQNKTPESMKATDLQ
ncbi:hypothetical protein [Pandoraea pnomenusa]|uniref:hypothetical protein n=1 Tax=Pandoraea pnomenusa TaxID=93220 RepID=UPI00242C8C53|nr:hypothetical protein [Pandoraea pnomenusa]